MAKQQPAAPARERLLAAAGELFYAHGINATGIDAIIARAGVSLATCYKQFGGKDKLVAAYLEQRHQRWCAEWEAAIADARDAQQAVLALFDALERWSADAERSRGCAHVDAAVEITDPEHPGLAVAAEHKQHLHRRLTALVAETGAGDPEQTASDVLVIYEGTITALFLDLTPNPFGRARRLTTAALREATR